jgi:hypothetical protein
MSSSATIPAKILLASAEGGRKRDSSRRSPAMVRTRNAIHSGATAEITNPASHKALPVAQLAAPSASVRVCSARWRRYTRSDPATITRLPAHSSAGPACVPRPASSASPPMPANSGAPYAQRAPSATARSRLMTVPKKAPIISGP